MLSVGTSGRCPSGPAARQSVSLVKATISTGLESVNPARPVEAEVAEGAGGTATAVTDAVVEAGVVLRVVR